MTDQPPVPLPERFEGTFTAIVTPFHMDGSLDESTLRMLVERQIEAGVEGLVPCGTTGEAATLEYAEHLRVVEIVAEQAGGRVCVMGGAGGSSTRGVVRLARDVAQAGATAVLSAVPAYNKPNQEGLLRHFSEVADASPVPLILYNVPGRTARDMVPATILRLANHDNVRGVKESSGSLDAVMQILSGAPDNFSVLCGDDDLALASIALGARGLVSVAANEAPEEVCTMVRAAMDGRLDEARSYHYRLLPLLRANFVDTNPIPVKAALHRMGLIQAVIRLPLVWADDVTVQAVEDGLRDAGLLDGGTAA